MPRLRASPAAGYTLIELITVMLLIAILTSAAVPSFRGTLEGLRVQSLVRRLTGDLHYARMLAVRDARAVDLVLEREPGGCVRRYLLRPRARPGMEAVRWVDGESSGLCLRHNGGAKLTFDGRGMARSGGKSFVVRAGDAVDTVVVSFAGRIRTGVRRRRRGLPATFSGSATISCHEPG